MIQTIQSSHVPKKALNTVGSSTWTRILSPLNAILGTEPQLKTQEQMSEETFFDFQDKTIQGESVSMSQFRDKKAILVVNVAS